MPKTRKRFETEAEINEIFLRAIRNVTGIISVIKEEAEIRNKLSKLQGAEKLITEEIKSLKISLKLINKEEIRKTLEEIISLKETELKENNDEFDRLNEQLSKCINELSEYQDYIARVYKFTDDGDLVLDSDLGLEKFSREEFIAYMLLSTNYGNYKFPSRYKEYIPENFHEIIEIYQTNTWNSFIKLIEEN